MSQAPQVGQNPSGSFYAVCYTCRDVFTRETERDASRWLEYHNAFIHYAGGCTSCAVDHPERQASP